MCKLDSKFKPRWCLTIFLVSPITWVQLKLPDRGKINILQIRRQSFPPQGRIALPLGLSHCFVFTFFFFPSSHLRHILMLVWPPPISCYCVSYYRLPSSELLSFHHLLVLLVEVNSPEAGKDWTGLSPYLKGNRTIIC